jgi:hypothetical protein
MSTDVNTIVTVISIFLTIYFGIGKHNAKAEIKRLKRFLDFKRMEDFSFRYRETLKSYGTKIQRVKWKETIQGKDIVGSIDGVLTEFNTHLPKMDSFNRQRLSSAIDEAKKVFIKVRKGDEDARDANLKRLNDIDRILNDELERQRRDFMDLM